MELQKVVVREGIFTKGKSYWIPDHLTCLLRNLYAGREVTAPDMKQQTGSK